MPARDLRDIPGTFGDPFQAIGSLPGVSPVTSGLSYFYVRGAPPADTGYFLDGIPLPTLFHLGPGPSVVPAELLDHIEFYPSAAPAAYGRFAGGIIVGELAPPSEATRREASIRLFDASAFVQTPLDGATTAVIAGRYGFPNLLLSVFAPQLSLSYEDYTVRLTRKLGGADTLSLLAIGGYDAETDAAHELTPVDTLFHRLDLRYDHSWAQGSVRIATTFGYDRTATELSPGPIETLAETSARARIEYRQRLSGAIGLSLGADANEFLDRSAGAPAAQSVAGAFVELAYRPAGPVQIVAGVRVDDYRTRRSLTASADPRIAVRIRVLPAATLITTLSVAHQPPTYFLPIPGLRLDPSTGLQTVFQYTEGVDVHLPWALSATVTGFYSADRNVNDFASSCGNLSINCNVVARVDGATYGLETIVRRAFSQRFAGWASYTFSRAERHIARASFLSPFDRTHVVSAVLRYDFGAGADIGLRVTYNSGRPDIPSVSVPGEFVDAAVGTTAVLQRRLPDFYRLDLRAQKRWAFERERWFAVVAEFFDVTLNQEAVAFRCRVNVSSCTVETIGPLALPSIGVQGGF